MVWAGGVMRSMLENGGNIIGDYARVVVRWSPMKIQRQPNAIRHVGFPQQGRNIVLHRALRQV